MTTITLDTGVLPANDLLSLAHGKDLEFAAVSVSERELEGTSFEVHLEPLPRVLETAVWHESTWDLAVWGADPEAPDSDRRPSMDELLTVISNGSFPPIGKRGSLSEGERNQLRDAMILEAHIRAGRDVFVTNDMKAFIKQGRRDRLAGIAKTRIMTRSEFLDLLKNGGAV